MVRDDVCPLLIIEANVRAQPWVTHVGDASDLSTVTASHAGPHDDACLLDLTGLSVFALKCNVSHPSQ